MDVNYGAWDDIQTIPVGSLPRRSAPTRAWAPLAPLDLGSQESKGRGPCPRPLVSPAAGPLTTSCVRLEL